MLSERERAGIVRHMNEDHADAIVLCARAFAGLGAVGSARLIDVDSDALTLEVEIGGGRRRVRIPLVERVSTLSAARRVLVEMTRAAREKLAGS